VVKQESKSIAKWR